MILFADNLKQAVTGAGIQPIATVAIDAGLLLDGVLRYSLSGRRTTGAGTSSVRSRIGGVDLLTAAGDGNLNLYHRGNASAVTPTNLRANGFSSRTGAAGITGLAVVNLADALDLTFDVDLGTDTDVFTFDDLTVEYLPSA